MCGRYGGPADEAVSAGHFDVNSNPFGPTMTINPTVRHKILAKNSQGVVAAIEARWGLIPHWYTGFESEWKGSTHNARLEEIETKPAYKTSWLKKRRIIAPAAHFYEWSGPKGRKKKYKISRADGQPFGMAGLWDHAKLMDGSVLSYAVMTKEPGQDVAAVHDREPCFLEPEQWETWLMGEDLDIGTPKAPGYFRVALAE